MIVPSKREGEKEEKKKRPFRNEIVSILKLNFKYVNYYGQILNLANALWFSFLHFYRLSAPDKTVTYWKIEIGSSESDLFCSTVFFFCWFVEHFNSVLMVAGAIRNVIFKLIECNLLICFMKNIYSINRWYLSSGFGFS